MGVTAIKKIVNQSGETVHLTNYENTGTNKTIDPRTTVACDIWIPWCTSQADFEHNHYLTVKVGSTTTWIWQSHEASGDRVRVSPEGRFRDNQTPIEGHASVNGDRTLYIRAYGLLEMEGIRR